MKKFNFEEVIYLSLKKVSSIIYGTFLILIKQYKLLELNIWRFFILKKIKIEILFSFLLFSEIVLRFDIFRELLNIIEIITLKKPSFMLSYLNTLNFNKHEYKKHILTNKLCQINNQNYDPIWLKKFEKKKVLFVKKNQLKCTVFDFFQNLKLKTQFLSYFMSRARAHKFTRLKKIGFKFTRKIIQYSSTIQKIRFNYNFLNLQKGSFILFLQRSNIRGTFSLSDYWMLYFVKTYTQTKLGFKLNLDLYKDNIVNTNSIFSLCRSDKTTLLWSILEVFFEEKCKMFYFPIKNLSCTSKKNLNRKVKKKIFALRKNKLYSEQIDRKKKISSLFFKSPSLLIYMTLTKTFKVRVLFYYFSLKHT